MKDRFRVICATPRQGKSVAAQFEMLNIYIERHLGKPVLIEITDSERIQELEVELEKAKKELRFYGNTENYEPKDYKGLHYVQAIGGAEGISDRGERARQVLKELEER